MSVRLPLEPLRAFVCAAQVASFRKAAQLMNLTPGAVSQRVAVLEDHIGAPLFRRTPQGVELLPRGKALLAEVAEPLERIEAALQRSSDPALLRVHTVASLANEWLIPRLGRFHAAHPSITVEIEAGARLADLVTGGSHADIAIRFGTGDFGKGLSVVPLYCPPAVLIAGPGISAVHGGDVGAVLRNTPLLPDRDLAEWDKWLARYGLDRGDVRWGSVLDDDAATISAVLGGQGIANVRDFYVKDRIDAGMLEEIARDPDPLKGYYLVGRPERLDRRDARAFAAWLIAEFQAMEDQVG